jgi:hypothetical protein
MTDIIIGVGGIVVVFIIAIITSIRRSRRADSDNE